MTLFAGRSLLLALATLGCAELEPRNLDELVLRDSTYYSPESLEPYDGPVFRPFPDQPERILLRGTLREGTWHGELEVLHPNGRVRYQGRLVDGAQCGAWVENRDSVPAGSVYEELVREVESMGMYPPCPEERGGLFGRR